MAMTIAEKILAAHCGRDSLQPGEIIMSQLDLALGNDVTAPLAVRIFQESGFKQVAHPDRIALVLDHFTPCKDIQTAQNCKLVRDFAREQGINAFFDTGTVGIEHVLLPQEGLVLPGDTVIGADSHTCTYGALGAFATGVGSTDLAAAMISGEAWFRVPYTTRFNCSGDLPRWVSAKDLILFIIGKVGVDGVNYGVMEFGGPTIRQLGMDGRFTICNMAIEAGGKTGIIEPDEITLDYVQSRARRPFTCYESDPDADYREVHQIDAGALEPLVACPHLPSNIKTARELTGTKIDQAVIGSCTNGRISDLREAAGLMEGKTVATGVRTIILPGTQEVYLQALREGLITIFIEAGAAVSTPTCGPCLGGHMGILAAGERAIATTNRNFVGRMGHPRSEVYLSGPAVAAASALAGEIVHPEAIGSGGGRS